MEEIDVLFDKNLDYIIELKGDLVEAKTLMTNGETSLTKYRGATNFLINLCYKYESLSENAKRHLHENINELEKLAVDTLVKEGYKSTVDKEKLEKYGYSVKD